VYKLFLSVAGDRTHIGTYVGVSPSPASNENNLQKAGVKIFLQAKKNPVARYENFYSGFFFSKSYPQFCLKSIVLYFDMRDN
jgi:hypothetical protein